MYTLVISSLELPAAPALGAAARASGASVISLEDTPAPELTGPIAYWGGSDVGPRIASGLRLALLEPPLDLLARLPYSLRLRAVDAYRFHELPALAGPTFVKPADAVHKVFDAGLYTDLAQLTEGEPVAADTPVLLSEPVEWLAEYRCFVLERKVAAMSPYLSFGQPSWRPYVPQDGPVRVPAQIAEVCGRLFAEMGAWLPPAFVVDVGLIYERGWAVVEFNPAWCSGLLGCDPWLVLPVLRCATRSKQVLTAADRRWLIDRSIGKQGMTERRGRP